MRTRKARFVVHLAVRQLAALTPACLILFSLLSPAHVAGEFSWDIRTVDQGVSGSGSMSIVLDITGRPHVAYTEASRGELRYGILEGATWNIQSIPMKDWAYGSISLVLDSVGLPHISYFDAQQGKVKYARFNGVLWTVLEVGRSHFEGYSSLAMDPEGTPHIAYVSLNGDLRLARLTGASWTSETVDAQVVTARYPSLAFDLQGQPQIAYYGNGELRYAESVTFGWWIDVIDGDSIPQFISLAIDSRNMPKIGYRDNGQSILLYAQWNGTVWKKEVVDAEGDVGWDASLDLDKDGYPHFSYYDRTLGVLKYAYSKGDTWIVRVVDMQGIVGWWSDIALNGKGRPHFIYYSWTDQAVRYAVGNMALGVRTWPAKDLDSTAATLVGELTSPGDASEVKVFFEWRPVGGQWRRLTEFTLFSPGFVEARLEGLEPESSYEYRTVVAVGGILLHGHILSFSTEPAPKAETLLPEYLVVLLTVIAVLGALGAYLLVVGKRKFISGETSLTPLRAEERWSRNSWRDRRER